jgi:hypothetical protein
VIVRDLDFVGIASLPTETDPVLIVYPYAVFTGPGSTQGLQPIAGRNREVSQIPYPVDLVKLPPGCCPEFQRADSTRATGVSAVEDILSPPISE